MKLNPHDLPEHIRKLNPQLFGAQPLVLPVKTRMELPVKKRIRQDSKPLLNNLETEFLEWLQPIYPSAKIRAQAKRYRLANGTWYKVDFTAILEGREHAWEVKGPHAFRGGFENLKVAAATYPEVKWILVWKENGRWQEQEILP